MGVSARIKYSASHCKISRKMLVAHSLWAQDSGGTTSGIGLGEENRRESKGGGEEAKGPRETPSFAASSLPHFPLCSLSCRSSRLLETPREELLFLALKLLLRSDNIISCPPEFLMLLLFRVSFREKSTLFSTFRRIP